MAASQFGPTTQVNHTAPSQAVQPGFLDSTGKLQPGQIDDSGNIKTTGGGGGGGGAVTIADGADVTEGAIADVAVTGDNSGTESAKLRGLNKIWADVWDSVNHWLKVSIQNTTLAVTQSGAWAVRVGGGAATNVAVADNPVNLGAQAVSSENAAVTTARMAQLVTDLVGKLIVLPYANPENFVSGAITSAMTGTTSTSLIGAPASGLRNYITQITVSNSHATVGTDVIVQDGSGGTTLYTIPAAAVYGGATLTFPTPLRQPTTATAIYVANVTTGASVKVSATGYKGA